MSRRVPWLLLGVSALVVLYLIWLLFNGGTELDDARSQVANLRGRSELALSILREDWIGKEASSVSTLSAECERRGVITSKSNDATFQIGDLIFEVKGGVVVGVRYFD